MGIYLYIYIYIYIHTAVEFVRLVLAMNTSITDFVDTDTLSIVALVFTVRRAQRPTNCAYIATFSAAYLYWYLGSQYEYLYSRLGICSG